MTVAGTGSEQVSLEAIREARERLGARVRRTPLLRKEQLAAQFGVPVYLKGEHLQRTGSFKLRGALNLIAQLDDDQRARGVVAASAGNHAQGVAVAATEFGIKARIYMPVDATLSKVEATRNYGAEVVLAGADVDEALAEAQAYAEQTGATLVHPFDDPRIVNGQGTCGLEIVEQLPEAETVIVPVGGGGLISGVAVAVRQLLPNCRVIGVQASAMPAMATALEHGAIAPTGTTPTMADGIAIRTAGALTFDLISEYVDEIVLVEEEDISASVLWLLERAKQVVEGAGATSLAALRSGRVTCDGPVVCLLSGGNIDSMLLMTIIRQGLTAVGRFVRIWTTIPDRPGELSKLLALLGEMKANVLAVEHKREGVSLKVSDTRVDLTLQTRNREHVDEVLQRLAAAGYLVSTR